MKNLLFISLLFLCNILNGQVIIGKTIKMEPLIKINGYNPPKIEVAQNNFPYQMNWEEAKEACKELGSRWRLPTADELGDMHYASEIAGSITKFNRGQYWSSTELSYTEALGYMFGMSSGSKRLFKDDKYFVRAVRSY